MNTRHNTLIVLTVILSFLSTGCSMAPTYSRPELPVPAAWPEGEAYPSVDPGDAAGEAAAIPWKDFFLHDCLQQVITLAIENNRDLKVATLNIEKMRALYKIQGSEHWPTVSGNAAASSQRIPESLSPSGTSYISRQHSLNVGISAYELDLFGRIKSLKSKALEQYLATEQAQAGARIALVSEVAGAWLTLAGDRERLKLAKDTFGAQQASYDMIKRRYDLGASSELDLHQARTRVEAARLDMARYTGQVAQDHNMLTLLVGGPVPEALLPESLSAIDRDTLLLKDVSPALPSSVLLNRPDILAAERQLKSVNANIGAARAAFFPRITLTGTFGVASRELDNLFDEGTVWSFMPQISIPLFTGGRNKANLAAAKVDRDIAVANYEKAIQVAFREVADALANRGTVDDQIKAQDALTAATAESYRLSDIRYKKGLDSYLSVLDAQRSLYSAQQNLINVRLMKLANRVTLYKVMGGGAL